jgi:hypothetical protein
VKIVSTPTYFHPDNGITLTNLDVCLENNGINGTASFYVVNDGDAQQSRRTADELVVGARDFVSAAWLDPGVLDPLAPEPLQLSKPLLGNVTAMLMPAVGSNQDLTPELVHGVTVAYLPARVLPLGFDGVPWAESGGFAGSSIIANFHARAPDDPGVQPQDGFESTLHVTGPANTPAVLVDGADALDGAKSLRIDAGQTTLLHLERSAGARSVRLLVEPVIEALDFEVAIDVRAGVTGGATIASTTLALDPAVEPKPSAGASARGAVRELTLELEEDGSDVLVSITTPSLESSTSASAGVIVDDLRIE